MCDFCSIILTVFYWPLLCAKETIEIKWFSVLTFNRFEPTNLCVPLLHAQSHELYSRPTNSD